VGEMEMKIRRDFVTNSSSSSFLLSFKDEDSIYNTLKKTFPLDVESGWSAGERGYFYQLLDEIESAKRLTKDEILEIIDDESYGIEWTLTKRIMNARGYSYNEVYNYLETEEGIEFLKKAREQFTNSIIEEIGDNAVTVEVEHGDDGEGEDGVLEHDILPYLSCTVTRFSHH
jgi:hypothetical protein